MLPLAANPIGIDLTPGQTPAPDLTLCDREPITFLEEIQGFGFLLAMANDWSIVRASANLQKVLGLDPGKALRQRLDRLLGADAIRAIRLSMASLTAVGSQRIFGVELLPGRGLFDLNLHLSGDLMVVEGERANGDPAETVAMVRAMMGRLARAATVEDFHQDAARQLRGLVGFDRVMIYRFRADGAGEVIAESIDSGVDSFLGLNYPASDIPRQARTLYLRNPFRIIADAGAVPVGLLPPVGATVAPLDLSLAITRSISPVHMEYLRNMGVGASLSLSIVVDGQLWGLMACHNLGPRLPGFPQRTAAELFAAMYSLGLESRLHQAEALEEQRARELADRLMTAIAGNDALLTDAQWLADMTNGMIASDGIAIVHGDEVVSAGTTPGRAEILALSRLLDSTSPSRVFDTDHLAGLHAPAAASGRAAGVLSIPISRTPRDYILLFRRELLQAIKWGGDPTKRLETTPDGLRLSPRKSFAAFAETVRGRSLAFNPRDRRIGEAVRVAMIEIVLRLTETNMEERRRAGERQDLLIAELNHRVRNILALIRSLVNNTQAGNGGIEGYVESLGGRVQALARAHDQLTQQNWAPCPLRTVFEDEIAAHSGSRGRIVLEGDAVMLTAPAVTTLSLVMHELVTNAIKYGALSVGGTVTVQAARLPGEGLRLRWRERGGPAVQAPTRRGFGTTLIERMVPFDLQGSAELRFAVGGLEAEFMVPENYLSSGPASLAAGAPASPGAVTAGDQPLAGLHVLLLEDSIIIAMEADLLLRKLGAVEVRMISSIAKAQAALAARRPDFAMLDIGIGNTTSLGFALEVRRAGVPFIFATGYGEAMPLDAELGSPVIVQKPYNLAGLAAAARQTLGLQAAH